MLILLLDKTIKLWKVSERDRKPEGFNLKDETGLLRDPSSIHTLVVSFSFFILKFPFYHCVHTSSSCANVSCHLK